jgi:hypothetical protein
LVHLAAGIGNVVLATPMLVALDALGWRVHVLLDADYPETAELLRPWAVVESVSSASEMDRVPACDVALPAVPPFYWPRFRRRYPAARHIARPPDALFYANEQRWYLAFATALGYPSDEASLPPCVLPIASDARHAVDGGTVVLAPGCKPGEMATKRWPYYAALAERFPDVVIVGTADDDLADGSGRTWPSHARVLLGRLTLRETAEVMAGAGAVVANDSGLAHIAAALGTPTVMLFGPTPDASLGPFPPHVTRLRGGLACEPCWFTARFARCGRRIDCLAALDVDRVTAAIQAAIPGST